MCGVDESIHFVFNGVTTDGAVIEYCLKVQSFSKLPVFLQNYSKYVYRP